MTCKYGKKLCDEGRQDIEDWDKQRRALGNQKTKAAQHGISVKRLEQIIYRARAKERSARINLMGGYASVSKP